MRENGIHIRVADIIYGLIKRRFLIIMLTVAGLLTGIVFSGIAYLRGEMSREYLVTSAFSVNTQTQTGLFTSGHDFPDYNDINMAKALVDAVSYTLKSDRMLGEIIDSLGLLGVSTKDIADNLELTQYNDTQIIEMSLYWRSSGEGISILTEINSKAPELLKETLGVGTVSVINLPSAQYLIGGRVNMILWGYMALLGFGLGMGITLLELLMRPTLINIQDMRNIYGLDILCEVADDRTFFRKGKSLLVEDERDSGTKENFASAAHIIQTSFRKKEGPHIIYVTSALRGEGKTSLQANLAVELSDLEKRVLLIDFDMQNPSLGGLFLKNIDYDHSLNALYEGEISEAEAVTSLSGYLDILPTALEKGTISLDSNLFQVVRRLADGYDYVLIDTAPVGLTADPMSLNQIASAALFVVRYDTASLQEIRDAVERINRSGVSILGCLVNGVKVSERGIKNRVKEKERAEQAKQADRRRDDKPVDLEQNRIYRGTEGAENDGGHMLVESFSSLGKTLAEEGPADITTSSHFVEQLFRTESNDTDAVQEVEEAADGAAAEADAEDAAEIAAEPELDAEDTAEAAAEPELYAEDTAETAAELELDAGDTAETAAEPELYAEDTAEIAAKPEPDAEDTDETPDPEGYAAKASSAIEQAQRQMEDLLKKLESL